MTLANPAQPGWFDRDSKGLWLSCAIFLLGWIFSITGGVLVNTYLYDYYNNNTGQYYGGVALVIIGTILWWTGLILIICRYRRRHNLHKRKRLDSAHSGREGQAEMAMGVGLGELLVTPIGNAKVHGSGNNGNDDMATPRGRSPAPRSMSEGSVTRLKEEQKRPKHKYRHSAPYKAFGEWKEEEYDNPFDSDSTVDLILGPGGGGENGGLPDARRSSACLPLHIRSDSDSSSTRYPFEVDMERVISRGSQSTPTGDRRRS